MRHARHVGRLGERTEAYVVSGGENLSERDHLEDLGLDGRILLLWIANKQDVVGAMGSIYLSRDGQSERAPVDTSTNVRVRKKCG